MLPMRTALWAAAFPGVLPGVGRFRFLVWRERRSLPRDSVVTEQGRHRGNLFFNFLLRGHSQRTFLKRDGNPLG
jgi:hypothetical protein